MNDSYNFDLALYDVPAGRRLHRPSDEYMPTHLETGETYTFVKPGHRNYLPEVPVTLMEIKKDDVLFNMKAQVTVQDAHFELRNGKAYTAGRFVVNQLL